MEARGTFKELNTIGSIEVVFELEEGTDLNSITELINKDLDIIAKVHREKRSNDANALLWLAIGRIANSIDADKWDVYLQMLKRYGKFTYICVKPEAVEEVKKQWRETEIVGEVEINGKKAIQLLCYYGSSTYNTKEFSVLLEGVVSEMKEMGLETPQPHEIKESLDYWEKQYKNKGGC